MARLFAFLLILLCALPVAARAETFRSDRIVVEVRGSGPDVILIPGLASTSDVWARTAERLDDHYRVHLVSVKGFGLLPAGGNGSGAVIAPVAGEIRRYIAAERLNRPALIGHSLGGLIALRVAADGGARIGRVMTVDSTPFFPALINGGATTGDVEPLARIAYQTLMLLGDDALKSHGAWGAELGGAADGLFDSIGWQGGDRRTLAQGLYEVMTVDLRHRLPDISAPVTVVYGWSPDGRSPRSHVETLLRAAYASLRRPARYEPIRGAEHMVMIDQPGLFMAAVNRFLAAPATARAAP